jgi:SAM-dependent methyltransferase
MALSPCSTTSTTHAQNEKTIQFWDDLYAADPTRHKEWILHPTSDILKTISDALPRPQDDSALLASTCNDHHAMKVLEIGCGSSTLAYHLWRYCQEQRSTPVSVIATDVSRVCIDQNSERDQLAIKEQATDNDRLGKLEYGVLDIAKPLFDDNGVCIADATNMRWTPNSYDMVLDKGCLDTFAFRSRQRGSRKDTLVNTVLNNAVDLLKDDNSSVYLIISPRTKFKAVQKYPGFSKVERIELRPGVTKAELVESRANPNKQSTLEREILFMYVCTKKRGFNPRQPDNQQPVNIAPPLADGDTCSKCGVSFLDFRKGEDIHGRGSRYWSRLFHGHGVHCKG